MGSERRGAYLSHPVLLPATPLLAAAGALTACSTALVEGQAVSGSCDPREFQEEAGHIKLDDPARVPHCAPSLRCPLTSLMTSGQPCPLRPVQGKEWQTMEQKPSVLLPFLLGVWRGDSVVHDSVSPLWKPRVSFQ